MDDGIFLAVTIIIVLAPIIYIFNFLVGKVQINSLVKGLYKLADLHSGTVEILDRGDNFKTYQVKGNINGREFVLAVDYGGNDSHTRMSIQMPMFAPFTTRLEIRWGYLKRKIDSATIEKAYDVHFTPHHKQIMADSEYVIKLRRAFFEEVFQHRLSDGETKPNRTYPFDTLLVIVSSGDDIRVENVKLPRSIGALESLIGLLDETAALLESLPKH